jgi:CRP/FNR family transcriptional regulator, cyclic AMP receptor protein
VTVGAMIEDAPRAEEHRLLARVDILEGLPQGEVDYVASHSATVRLGKKESFAPGQDSRRILLLLRGRVRVHEPSAGGQDLTISVVEDGTVLGHIGFAPRRSRALRVEALEPSLLGVVWWERFEVLVFRNPKVGVKTISLLSKRLAVCEGRLSDQVSKEVPARLASLVLELSEHQGVVTGDGNRRIPIRYTHRQLASMVGSNREAVTRAFGKLRKAGAVELRNRQIYVTDAEALNRLAETER